MTALIISLIVIGGLILMGPVMLLFAKLNKVDPFILEKDEEVIKNDEKSLIIVNILKPLFAPLWIETKIIRWFRALFKKK